MEIRLFGEFRITVDGVPVEGLHAMRLQTLIAYLLLFRGIPQSRQQLAFRFWPETSDRQAQTNLRQLLHTLRRRLPSASDYLLADERTVCWNANEPLHLDVATFEAALGRAGQTTGREQLNAIEEAIAIYTGDLLPDCYDDWILPERERLTQRFLAALEKCVRLREERREYRQAIERARQLLAAEPFHEATYRQLMRLHTLEGERAAALRVYHTCATLFEQELGAEPSAATRELYENLVTFADDTVEPQSRHLHFALVGRQREWQRMQMAWRTAVRGAVHCILLSGEAGIGKTRLAEEMTTWARRQGMHIAMIGAYAAGRELAFEAVIECLRSPPMAPLVRRLDPVWRTELARLLPELKSEDPQLPLPEPLLERWQRQRFFEALARVFVPRNRPVLIQIDDLQWHDSETLEWLAFLVRYQPQARLMLVLSLRVEEIDADHPVTALLLDLRSAGLLTELDLGPLTVGETLALVSQLTIQTLDDQAIETLYRITEGNPLFVVETMRAAPDEGRFEQTSGSTSADALAFRLPARIQAVIQARLAHLSPPARDLAAVAATIGRSFNYAILAAACGQGEDQVVSSLDELWQRRIVREQGTTDYDFTHDHIRSVAYSGISPARRKLLHRRVADALEAAHAGNLGAVSAQLAYHREQGGQIRQAIVYLQQAAEVASGLYAYQEAILLLERGLALAGTIPPTLAMLEIELELQMALCNAWAATTSYLGRQADQAYTRALELCRQVQHTPHLFRVLWGMHSVALYRADYAESVKLARQCVHIAMEIDDQDMLVEAHHAAWGPYFFLGDYQQALVHIDAGLALYERQRHEPLSVYYGIHDPMACGLNLAALACWQMGMVDQACRRLDADLLHAQALKLPADIADAYAYAGLLYHLLRDPVAAQNCAEIALRISNEKGYPGQRMFGALVLGWSLAIQGQTAEGIALARQGMAVVETYEQRLHYSQLAAMLAEALILGDHQNEAIDILDEAILRFEKYQDRLYAPDLHTLRGEALLALGAGYREVEQSYRDALGMARRVDARISGLRAATRLTSLQQAHTRSTEGHQILLTLYGQFTEGHDSPDLLAARSLLDDLSPEE